MLQTLDDLCHLEAAMASFYLACSEKWKSISSLWMELAIEESIIEGRFFDIIISQNKTYLKFRETMNRDLAQHRQMIIEEIELVKKGD